MYMKFKEARPEQTVERIRSILTGLDMFVSEKWTVQQEDKGLSTYSLRLSSPYMDIGVNGKGTTPEYALASAYSEFMERLQNFALVRRSHVTEVALSYLGFSMTPDEKSMSKDALITEDTPFLRSIVKNHFIEDPLLEITAGNKYDAALSQWAEFLSDTPDAPFECRPFYSVKGNKAVYLPDGIIWILQGSNGMASGNTPAEALVQGLSEIFERYAFRELLKKRYTPPDIPDDVIKQYPGLLRIKEQLEALGPFRVICKDCSLGIGLPVVGICMIDCENQRYTVSLGAHPSFPVALERCFTELLQGYDPRNKRQNDEIMQPFRPEADKLAGSYYNVLNSYIDRSGILPIDFFGVKPSWEYSGYQDCNACSNSELLEKLLTLMLTLTEDVYIRDMSFLGFPAFYIVAPDISYNELSSVQLNRMHSWREIVRLVSNSQSAGRAEYKRIIRGLRHNRSVSAFKPIFGVMEDCELQLICHLALGEENDALRYIQTTLTRASGIGFTDVKPYRCLMNDIELRSMGVNEENRNHILSLMFGSGCMNRTMKRWRGQDALQAFRDRNISIFKNNGLAEQRSGLFMRLKESALNNMPPQDLSDVIRWNITDKV